MIIGYVGLGAMGAPMTARLAAAYPGALRVYDADAAATSRVCAETGAEAAGAVADAAAACDLLFTCLPDSAVTRSVYLGPRGVAASIRAGAVTVDCSTVDPETTQDVHRALADRGVSHLDASMLGSTAEAEAGTLGFLVGGEAAALARAQPALEACGRMIRHVGPSGAGCRLKLILQTLEALSAVATAEALGLCLETGADPGALLEILGGGGLGAPRFLETRAPRLRRGDFSPLYSLRFLLKDAQLAQGMTDGAAEKFPALAAAVSTLEQAEAAGFGPQDCAAVLRAVEARIGKRVPSDG